jgi:hypothetical protein
MYTLCSGTSTIRLPPVPQQSISGHDEYVSGYSDTTAFDSVHQKHHVATPTTFRPKHQKHQKHQNHQIRPKMRTQAMWKYLGLESLSRSSYQPLMTASRGQATNSTSMLVHRWYVQVHRSAFYHLCWHVVVGGHRDAKIGDSVVQWTNRQVLRCYLGVLLRIWSTDVWYVPRITHDRHEAHDRVGSSDPA